MPSGKARSFGKSVLTLSLDDRVSQGLKRMEAKIGKIGASITGMGKKIAGAGAAILGPLAGAAATFASVGDSLNKMSVRTGFSAQALSELSHAAEASGTNLAAVEKSARGMAKTLLAAEQGSRGAIDKLSELGLTVDDLAGKKPERQFEILADRIASIEDSSRKAAVSMAIFGKAGSELLPLFADGVEGMNALRKEAVDLGITLNDEDAAAAAALTDALGRLKEQTKAIIVQIGAAVAGPLTEFADKVKLNLKDVIDWIRSNSELIVTIGKLGAVVATIGAPLIAIGAAFNVVTVAVGGLRVAFTALAAHPVIAALTVIGAAAAYVASQYRSAADAAEDFDKAVNKAKTDRTNADPDSLALLIKRFEQLAAKTKLTRKEADEARKTINALSNEYGNLASSIKDGQIVNADKTRAQLQTARGGKSYSAQNIAIGLAEAALEVRAHQGAEAFEIEERQRALAAMREEFERTKRVIADAKPISTPELSELLAKPQESEKAGAEVGTKLGESILDSMRGALQSGRSILGDLVRNSLATVEQLSLVTSVDIPPDLAPKIANATASLGNLSATVNQQAIFDATFAGQQFGSSNEEIGLLRELRDSNKKIAERVKPGIPVS